MSSYRSRRGRATPERLGDRPEFREWMTEIESAIESRESPARAREVASHRPRRKGWFLRARSLPRMLLQR